LLLGKTRPPISTSIDWKSYLASRVRAIYPHVPDDALKLLFAKTELELSGDDILKRLQKYTDDDIVALMEDVACMMVPCPADDDAPEQRIQEIRLRTIDSIFGKLQPLEAQWLYKGLIRPLEEEREDQLWKLVKAMMAGWKEESEVSLPAPRDAIAPSEGVKEDEWTTAGMESGSEKSHGERSDIPASEKDEEAQEEQTKIDENE
jgi:hypothetical protein